MRRPVDFSVLYLVQTNRITTMSGLKWLPMLWSLCLVVSDKYSIPSRTCLICTINLDTVSSSCLDILILKQVIRSSFSKIGFWSNLGKIRLF